MTKVTTIVLLTSGLVASALGQNEFGRSDWDLEIFPGRGVGQQAPTRDFNFARFVIPSFAWTDSSETVGIVLRFAGYGVKASELDTDDGKLRDGQGNWSLVIGGSETDPETGPKKKAIVGTFIYQLQPNKVDGTLSVGLSRVQVKDTIDRTMPFVRGRTNKQGLNLSGTAGWVFSNPKTGSSTDDALFSANVSGSVGRLTLEYDHSFPNKLAGYDYYFQASTSLGDTALAVFKVDKSQKKTLSFVVRF